MTTQPAMASAAGNLTGGSSPVAAAAAVIHDRSADTLRTSAGFHAVTEVATVVAAG
ncbi:MAG: hypothetical protein ABI307_12570 [Mycobacterium sp.]